MTKTQVKNLLEKYSQFKDIFSIELIDGKYGIHCRFYSDETDCNGMIITNEEMAESCIQFYIEGKESPYPRFYLIESLRKKIKKLLAKIKKLEEKRKY